jgi:hypothetical protein
MLGRPRHLTVMRRALIGSFVIVCAATGLFAAAASANTTTAKLKLSPGQIFTCSESSPVTFTVSGFAANSSVNLEIGATKADPAAVISTNASGDGSTVLEFGVGQGEHDYFAGDYKFFATQSTLEATKTLTVSTC